MTITTSPGHITAGQSREPLVPPGTRRLFVLITALFFIWGIPNNLNDILIRQFMKSFVLTRFEAGLVQSAFYLGYFLLALPAGLLIKKRGYKVGFLSGLFFFAFGCLLFWPAALLSSYIFFLGALFVVASGLSFLETAANPFIAQLGPSTTSERRLNLAQAFNPVGAITGALIGTRFIFSGVELNAQQVSALRSARHYTAYLHHETLRVVAPYLVLAAIAITWGGLIVAAKFPVRVGQGLQESHSPSAWHGLVRKPALFYAVIAQFMYVGAQVGTWSYFISYAQEYTRVSERYAGLLLSATLAAFGLGRFASAYIMRWVAPGKLMLMYSVVNVLLLAVGIIIPGWSGLLCVLLTSFFMSIMYPTIFAIGLRDMGPETNIAGSLLVMAILGGAVLTPLMGLIAQHTQSTALAYVLPACSYFVIALFSWSAPAETV